MGSTAKRDNTLAKDLGNRVGLLCRATQIAAPPSWRLCAGWKPALQANAQILMSLGIVAAIALLEPAQLLARTQGPAAAPVREDDAAPQHVLVISIRDRKLAVTEKGRVLKVYRVAVGAAQTPSPTGTLRIVNKVADPTYCHQGKVIPPGKSNPLGDRWMGLSKSGYGIHGTNAPASIGKAASHGCIRMGKRDVEELFALARVGDNVEIHAEPDATVAAIFGNPPAKVPPPFREARAGLKPGATPSIELPIRRANSVSAPVLVVMAEEAVGGE